jgi:hypothetical protein
MSEEKAKPEPRRSSRNKGAATAAARGEDVPVEDTVTTGPKEDPPHKDPKDPKDRSRSNTPPPVSGSDPLFPTSLDMDEQVVDEQLRQLYNYGGDLVPWFTYDFLVSVLYDKMAVSMPAQDNAEPTLYMMVGPACVGKSIVKMTLCGNYVVSVDVDDILLFGKKHLGTTINDKGKIAEVIQGVQFKYPELLWSLRDDIFQAATIYGEGKFKNIILDTTGSMIGPISGYIRKARTLGYKVKVIIVYSGKKMSLERLKIRNKGPRYIPPYVVSSMYDKFLEDQKAAFFVLDDRITSQIDEIFLVDNNSADPTPHIVATGMKDEDGNFSWDVPTDRDSSLVDTDGMFYGLTIHSAKYGTPNISRGTPEDIRAITEKAHREWVEFDKAETAEKETTTKAASASASASAAGQGGYSRKRRLHINRPRKTMKKYTRRVTRRRGHGHGRGRRSQRR